MRLQYQADKSVTAIVYDTLYCLLKLCSCIGRHTAELVVKPLVHKLVQRFAEYVALPYLCRVFLKLSEQISYKVLRLLFTAYYRIYLCVDICKSHMD